MIVAEVSAPAPQTIHETLDTNVESSVGVGINEHPSSRSTAYIFSLIPTITPLVIFYLFIMFSFNNEPTRDNFFFENGDSTVFC